MSGIDYHALAHPKGRPILLEKRDKKMALAKEERECRQAVDARDQHRCFFPGCKKYAGEKHHIVSRSVRGKTIWRSDDILSGCHEHHAWFKAGLIYVTGNPDRAPVKVHLTALGHKEEIRIPKRVA